MNHHLGFLLDHLSSCISWSCWRALWPWYMFPHSSFGALPTNSHWQMALYSLHVLHSHNKASYFDKAHYNATSADDRNPPHREIHDRSEINPKREKVYSTTFIFMLYKYIHIYHATIFPFRVSSDNSECRKGVRNSKSNKWKV